MISDSEREYIDRTLYEAYKRGRAASVSSFCPLSIDEGYAVQDTFLSFWIDEEGPFVGYKLGFTNDAVQQEIGVSEPVYGRLLADSVDVGTIETYTLVAPHAEPEIEVRLGDRLPTSAPREQVSDAVATVAPAIEIVDSRMGSWQLDSGIAVGDNALASHLVTGQERPLSGMPLLSEMDVTLSGPDSTFTGHGSSALGGPLRALSWLSETLREPLPADTLISTGSLTETVPVQADHRITASFSSLEDVIFEPK